MRIRTQLVAAFLLLAVVPLASIVLFSYFTSIRAVQRAVEAEASQRTAEMDQRMRVIRTKLARGVSRLSQVPFGALLRNPQALPPPGSGFLESLMTEIGDAAPYLDALRVVPRPPPAPPEGVPSATLPPGEAPAAPEPLRIDVARLRRAFGDLRQVPEAATVEGEGAGGDAATELGRETAGLAMLGMARALEALSRVGDEEAHRKLEEALEREIELRAERLGDHIEKVTAEARAAALERADERRRRTARKLLGQGLGVEIHDRGTVVAEVHAEVEPGALLHGVMAEVPREPGEIPFALDGEGRLYTERPDDRALLDTLELGRDPETRRARADRRRDEWMIVSTVEPETDLIFGVAHPIGASLAEIRGTTARNLTIGLGLVGLALLGVLPISKRITRGLDAVTAGAGRIARGDLTARVRVSSKNEIGQLAAAFNRMAEDLSTHQERLVREEGRRREQELEFQRKSRELEDARQFQLSLLPKSVPRHPRLEVAVAMRPATEVGGDYYDFHLAGDGTLTLAIGDATGHGARAGTMVTVVKSLFSSMAAELPLVDFLQQAARTVRRMDLERMGMALTVARFDGERLALSAAGMPPALVHRAGSGEVEELALAGMPLGGLASDYEERRTELAAGDTVLLLSDGLPELPDANGEPLGYAAVRQAFAAAAAGTPDEVIAELNATAARWAGGGPPSDDMTFLVVRRT